MICSYCNREFTPKRKTQTFCSKVCNARFQANKLVKLPKLRDAEWLFNQYWIKKRSMRYISRELGCAESRVYVFMDKLGISRRSISSSLEGKKRSAQHSINLSEAAKGRWRGSNNPNWKGGLYRKTLEPRFKGDYSSWRKQIDAKYDYKCAHCGKQLGGRCNCCDQKILSYHHHIKSVATHPELVTDLENGILLCYSCHRMLHTAYKDKRANSGKTPTEISG